jgi:hypothetical protein
MVSWALFTDAVFSEYVFVQLVFQIRESKLGKDWYELNFSYDLPLSRVSTEVFFYFRRKKRNFRAGYGISRLFNSNSKHVEFRVDEIPWTAYP